MDKAAPRGRPFKKGSPSLSRLRADGRLAHRTSSPATEGADLPGAGDTALLALTDVSLIRRDPFEDGTPAVTVHRLVQAVARTRTGTRDSAASAAKRIGLRLAARGGTP